MLLILSVALLQFSFSCVNPKDHLYCLLLTPNTNNPASWSNYHKRILIDVSWLYKYDQIFIGGLYYD